MQHSALVTPVLILLFLEVSSGLPITGPCDESNALLQIRQACQTALATHAQRNNDETHLLEADGTSPTVAEVTNTTPDIFHALTEHESFTTVLQKIEHELGHMNELATEVIDPLLSFATQLGEWFSPVFAPAENRIEDSARPALKATTPSILREPKVTVEDNIDEVPPTPTTPLPPLTASSNPMSTGPALPSVGIDANPTLQVATTGAATLAASILIIALLIGMKGFLVHLYRKLLGESTILLGQRRSVPSTKGRNVASEKMDKFLENSYASEKVDLETGIIDNQEELTNLSEKYPILETDRFDENAPTKTELKNLAADFVPFHPIESLRGTDAAPDTVPPPMYCAIPTPENDLGVATSKLQTARRQALALPVTPLRTWMFHIMFLMLGWSTFFVSPHFAAGGARPLMRRTGL